MLDKGFVLVHRSLLKWEWYDDINTTRLFLHLLLTVNYEPRKWKGVIIQRGQRVASLGGLAAETGLSVQNVRTAISHLKSTRELTYKPHAKFGLFTVVNYDLYQTPNTMPNTQLTDCQHATNNNVIKQNKAIKEKDTPYSPPTGDYSPKGERKQFKPPTLQEVTAYCLERQNDIDPAAFIDHYAARGWRYNGNVPMKDWKAAVRTWEGKRRQDATPERQVKYLE